MSQGTPKSPPAITAPVSRLLAVADVARSVTFYRDVLGFEARDGEVTSGPARIQIRQGETAADSTGEPRPRGAAMLFFQTDDIARMRELILARGGAPGTVEKVNWIKMRMFELRDPDGHTLWFGQSYQEPEQPTPPPMLQKSLPELPHDDVSAGVAHYRDILGFHINFASDELGVMDRDEVTVVLIRRSAKHTGIGSCYVYIGDADALHAELVAKGANVLEQPVSYPWGLRHFRVLDGEGNQITFGQTFE